MRLFIFVDFNLQHPQNALIFEGSLFNFSIYFRPKPFHWKFLFKHTPESKKSLCRMKTAIVLLICLVQATISASQFIELDSAYVEGDPSYYTGMGDLWMTTWGADDRVYATWGDGTGLGDCYPRFHPELDECRMIDTASLDGELWYTEIFCGLEWSDCADSIYCPCHMTDAGLFRVGRTSECFHRLRYCQY